MPETLRSVIIMAKQETPHQINFSTCMYNSNYSAEMMLQKRSWGILAGIQSGD